MSAAYPGLPAAASVEQSIILAQLELLRRLDPARVPAAKAALNAAIRFLGVAGLLAASTAQAQSPQTVLLNQVPTGHGIARELSHATARVETTPVLAAAGERALLGRVEHRIQSTSPAGSTDSPIDGARALLGQWRSEAPVDAAAATGRSSYLAEVRGDVVASTSGDAEFGAIPAGDGSSSALTVSLGARGQQSAILFTRGSGAPLGVGRYRISDAGNGADEIQALVVTGSPTSPTGVFRGRSGWLVVTAASDRVLTGRFQVDGVGFLAAEPEVEDRPVNVAGWFSAASAR